MRPSRSVSSVASRLSSTEERKMLESASSPTTSPTTVQTTAAMMSRAERELSLRPIFGVGIFQAIAKATHRLNQIGVQLPAQPSDEDLDCIRVAVEILIVKVLDQLGTRHHATLVVGKIGKEAILERGQLNRVAIQRHPAGAGVDAQWTDLDVRSGEPGSPRPAFRHCSSTRTPSIFGKPRSRITAS